MESNAFVPARRSTPCPYCKWGSGTFFTSFHDGLGLAALYHCSGHHCSRFFVHSFPKPDFHSVKNTTLSPAQKVSDTVTPSDNHTAMTGWASLSSTAPVVTPAARSEAKAFVEGQGGVVVVGQVRNKVGQTCVHKILSNHKMENHVHV